MMRWWDNEGLFMEKAEFPLSSSDSKSVLSEEATEMRRFIFRVRADTVPGETLAVTGNCDTLGNWKHDQMFILTKEKDENDRNDIVWFGEAVLPVKKKIEYRYVIAIIVEPDGHKLLERKYIIRRWETNFYPRKLSLCEKDHGYPEKVDKPQRLPEPDTMGFYCNTERIDRGWLTSETAIQLKLFGNNLQVWKTKLQGRKLYVKVTPVNLTRANSVSTDVSQADDCLSLETMDITDKTDCWPVVEIGAMNQSERQFRFQDQFGRVFNEEDFIVFQILVLFPETVAFLMDFYAYPTKHIEEEPPYHVGFSYVLPSVMKHSEGQVVVPITSVKHRPIGQVTVEYLVVKPIANYTCDLSYSLHKRWKESWSGLDVGHRGVGTSFKGDVKQCAEVRENTIASLKAAASHGADFVEFDVQLSRDLIPVLYHDFYVAIAMRRKKQISNEEMIQLPLKDLSLEQLHKLKLFHVTEASSQSLKQYLDEEHEEHQPFPTLHQALEILDPCVGFNIEIKWTMRLKDGTYELYHPFDLNLYLDTVLEVVLKHAGTRNIIFSCFHPDICSMIRLKQNRYPVMFLTQGTTDKYPPYHDPRCQSVPMAVHFAVNMDILGINVHTEDLLRDSSQVALAKRAGLVLFCWGDDNNDAAMIKHLKELGLHAVIYDKINEYNSKEVKESIFRLEARESEKLVIMAAAERASSDCYLHPPTGYQSSEKTPEAQQNYMLNIQDALKKTVSHPSDVSLWTKDPVGHSSSADLSKVEKAS